MVVKKHVSPTFVLVFGVEDGGISEVFLAFLTV